MNNLTVSFKQESLELLDQAENALLELEKQCLDKFVKDLEDKNQEIVHTIFRAIHTIKGNSGLFDLEKIKELSHVFENVLSLVRNSEVNITKNFIDVCLLGIDRLREMVQNLEESNDYEIQDLIKDFNSFLIKSEQKEETISTHIVDDYDKITKKYINKLSHKINELYKSLKNDEKIYFVMIELNKEDLLSTFVDKIKQIKEEKTIKIVYQNLIYPLINNRVLYFFVIISNEENFELPFPIVYKSLIPSEAEDTSKESKNEVSTEDTIPLKESSSNETNTEEKKTTIKTSLENQENKETKEESFLKIPSSLVDELINIAGESIIARNELLQKLEKKTYDYNELLNTGRKISNLISLMQANLMKLRLQELNVFFERVPRLVRELARETHKEVEVEIEGGSIELDKTLIDAIRDPLTHIIRNAIDHGIESPEERIKKGKPPKGKIIIKAFFQGGNIIIRISDDGRGINLEKVKQKAILKDIITKEQAETLSKKEIIDLIFLPGLSTADQVTERSGRGVGMDVVKTSIKAIKGFINIESEMDQGTTITLTIPQTLSIVNCLLIKIYDRRYGIQQNQIQEILKINKKQLFELHGNLVYELRGNIIPIIHPYFIFKDIYKDKINFSLDFEFLVLLETDQHIFGLLVHDILNPEELMIKSLGEDFNEIPYYSGGSILGDGDTILIFDVMGLAKSFNIEANRREIETLKQEVITTKKLMSQFLIFDSFGTLFGIPIQNKPRITDVPVHELETLLNFKAFKYQNQLIPILEIHEILKRTKENEMFLQKSIYAILIPTKNQSYISIEATDILNITNEFDGFTEENDETNIILGYSIYKGKTVVLLNINNIITYWDRKIKTSQVI